jgi:hypothetical protein
MNTPLTDDQITSIASVTHEANRAYCHTLNDFSQLAWSDAPAWQRDSAIAGVKSVLDGSAKTPEEQHETWCAFKVADGWTYGAVKDATAKTHPCLVPYAQLPAAQKYKDILFRAAAVALTTDPDAPAPAAVDVAATMSENEALRTANQICRAANDKVESMNETLTKQLATATETIAKYVAAEQDPAITTDNAPATLSIAGSDAEPPLPHHDVLNAIVDGGLPQTLDGRPTPAILVHDNAEPYVHISYFRKALDWVEIEAADELGAVKHFISQHFPGRRST